MSFALLESSKLSTNEVSLFLKNDKKVQIDELDPIQFKSLQFSYNLTPGSTSSIEFHKSLAEVENLSTFRSPTIQAILTYKWN